MLDREKRKEAGKRVTTAGILLGLSMILGFAVNQATQPGQVAASPEQVEQLKQDRAEQAARLTQMRQLFVYCQTSGFRLGDDRCVDPTESRTGTLAVSTPVARVVRESDNSDDSDDSAGTTVVVQQPHPTSSPSRGSQRPVTTANQRSGKATHRHSGRHGGNGHRSTGRS